MKKDCAAEARLRAVTKTDKIVPDSVRAVQVTWVQAFALYGSKLWWDPKEVGRRDDLLLLLNRQARSVLGALPTTPRGSVMKKSGLTPGPVILDARQKRFAARLPNACSCKPKELHEDPSSGTPICQLVDTGHEHARTTKGMSCPAPGDEPVVKSIILDDKSTAKSAARRWAREKDAKVRVGVWVWSTDRRRSDDGRVGAAAVCKHSNEWRTRCSYLSTWRMEVFEIELWVIGLALGEPVQR
jgi:hypothetical protein